MKLNPKKKKPIHGSELDPKFTSQVMEHEDAQGLHACFACGTCTAGCPIHEAFPEYDPKKIAKMVKLGMRKVLSSPHIWYCATCHNCEQHCPQNVKFYNVLNVLKNLAAKEGYAPSPWVEQTRSVMQSGLALSVDEELVKKRKVLSLPAIKGDGTRAKRLVQITGADKIKARRRGTE